jgi:hypothetical protein
MAAIDVECSDMVSSSGTLSDTRSCRSEVRFAQELQHVRRETIHVLKKESMTTIGIDRRTALEIVSSYNRSF